MECLWQVEIQPSCLKVLENHWPKVKRYADVKHFAPCESHKVDVICGGFPCQPVSFAGKGRAQNDERWLWPDFFRIVKALKPQFILVENVPGLLNRGMGGVLRDLAEIGYDAEWDVVSAQAFGAPHLRERVLIVAYPNGKRRKAVLQSHTGDGDSLEKEESKHSGGNSRLDLAGVWTGAAPLENGKLHKPGVPLLVDGFPGAVDEVSAYGNAVVPQMAEWAGRRILNAFE